MRKERDPRRRLRALKSLNAWLLFFILEREKQTDRLKQTDRHRHTDG